MVEWITRGVGYDISLVGYYDTDSLEIDGNVGHLFWSESAGTDDCLLL